MSPLSQGLVVPVIRNVEGMNFADIEKAINLLGEKVICLWFREKVMLTFRHRAAITRNRVFAGP